MTRKGKRDGKVEPLLENAVSIWQQMLKSGLAPDTYDKKFAIKFRKRLELRPSRSIKNELQRVQPTVNEVVEAFLRCAKPFDNMARDVWQMFVEADARFSDENLRIAFDFGKGTRERLDLDLNHFKAFQEEYRRLRALVSRFPLSHEFLRNLLEVVSGGIDGLPSSEIATWIASYEGRKWVTPLPQLPRFEDPDVDLPLREARSVVVTVVGHLVANGIGTRDHPSDHSEIGVVTAEDDITVLELRVLIQENHDRWPSAMLHALDRLATRLAKGDKLARKQVDELAAFLEGHRRPEEAEETETLGTQLRAFLNLPLWKARDQLFGLWVCSQIANVVGYNALTFHPVNDSLHFRFKATHIATIHCEPPLHLFAELRTPARKLYGEGRKRGIQPDWRLVRTPVNDTSSQVLIVECKQYATPSRKKFLAAAIDYALNGGNAKVVLVNYGDMNLETRIAKLPQGLRRPWTKVQDRVSLIGGFRPKAEAAQQQFRQIILPLIPGRPATDRPGKGPEMGRPTKSRMRLWWDDPAVDLRLFVWIRFPGEVDLRSVSYKDKGSLKGPPWLELKGEGLHQEIEIAKWCNAIYEVVVVNGRRRPLGLVRFELQLDDHPHEYTWDANKDRGRRRHGRPWHTWVPCTIDSAGVVKEADLLMRHT